MTRRISAGVALSYSMSRGEKKAARAEGRRDDQDPSGLQRVAVLLTEEQYAALRRVAYERQASQSEVVREALDAWLEGVLEGK